MDERYASAAAILQPLLLLLIILAVPVSSQDEGPVGLSIDCGSETNYTDSAGIRWVTDAGYISSGNTLRNLSVHNDSGPLYTLTNRQQCQSLRYFDEGRVRECYVLPMIPETTYLVRTTFFYPGDWNNSSSVTAFDVYLNANLWLSFQFRPDSTYNVPYLYEAVVYAQNNALDVCLVMHQGTPFISALELRSLPGMYISVVAGRKFMGTLGRVNMGAADSEVVRYPDDQFDRIWFRLDSDNIKYIKAAANLTISPDLTPERPPMKVMQDAWTTNASVLEIEISKVQGSVVGPVAIYSYFQELNASDGSRLAMNYSVNAFRTPIQTSSQPHEVSSGVLTVTIPTITITITTSTQKTPPFINALELYQVYDWNGTVTNSTDEEAIIRIKNQLNMTAWNGDPCVPKPYSWLTCSGYPIPQGQSVSSNNQTFPTGFTPYLRSFVTGLSLANYVTIQTLPAAAIRNLSSLTSLNLSNTGLASLPSTGLGGQLIDFDLSNNRLTGGALEFIKSINARSIQSLYAANNSLDGQFPIQELYAEFPNLVEAKFDDNPKIIGILNLSSWHTTLQSSVQTDAVKATTTSTPAPAPTPAGPPGSTSSNNLPVVSLRNNGITGITPSLDELSSYINTYLEDLHKNGSTAFYTFGVLLAGNPWCQQKEFSAQSLTQQYLCRDSPTQNLPGLASHSSSNNTNKVGAIIGGVVGGIALVLACVFLVGIWTYWRRSSSLKEVQEALARQKVQPPFYAYSALRAATNDFSPENKLGQGTFGDVYKGTLVNDSDATQELLAVKRLYPTQQALTEFMNEVVLITGIKHRNLVQLKGCCIHKEDQRMLVYEFSENGNLAEALWDQSSNKDADEQEMKPTLDWQQRLNICVGIARGLSYLHEELQPRIIHRDIKPYNILMDKNFNAKIADFGLARSVVEGQAEADFTTIAGTKGYFAPEYATQGQLTEHADVFSFGVVLLEIVSGRKSIDFHSVPEEKQYLQAWARQLKEKGKLLDLLDLAIEKTADNEEVIRVINLAFLCLEFYPERRPTMSQAVAMLQGIMDGTLYTPDESSQLASGPSDPHEYMKVLHLDEEYRSESFSFGSELIPDLSAASGDRDPALELSHFSPR